MVKANMRLSCADCAVLMTVSVVVCTFTPELSVAHLAAIFHLRSQSNPALHVILSCPGRPPFKSLWWEQLELTATATPRTKTIRYNRKALLRVDI